MSEKNRVRRPELQRNEPSRGGWTSLFAPSGEPDDSHEDPLARSVDLAYRVSEEYLRQAQNAAEQIGRRNYGPEAFVGDLQEIWGRSFQYTSEFMDAAMQMMGQAATGVPPQDAASPHFEPPPTNPRDTSTQAPANETSPANSMLTIRLLSSRPAEVSVDFNGRCDASLQVFPLRSAHAELPPIEGVSIEQDRIILRVPGEQPEGFYSGLILDVSTQKPVGSVTVHILPVEDSLVS